MLPPVPEPLPDVRWRHEFQPGDLGRIVGLHGEIYRQEFGWESPLFEVAVAEGLAAFARTLPERAAAGLDRLWIAEMEGRYAGSLAVSGGMPAADVAQLRWVVVDPSRRGVGLGRRMVGEALAFCRACPGCRSVRLFTTREQHAAIRLYRAFGFAKTGEETYGRWGHPVVMEWYALVL